MTSFKQFAANRQNSLKSTGPKTQHGKAISRQNARRHGLTAETVVHRLEEADDYRVFEDAIFSDHDPRTKVERELVLRLASLLWRLRRATLIESGLLEIQADILHGHGRTLRGTADRHQSTSRGLACCGLGTVDRGQLAGDLHVRAREPVQDRCDRASQRTVRNQTRDMTLSFPRLATSTTARSNASVGMNSTFGDRPRRSFSHFQLENVESELQRGPPSYFPAQN